ncbi:MAG: protein kinase [Pirellulaceae bacterium]
MAPQTLVQALSDAQLLDDAELRSVEEKLGSSGEADDVFDQLVQQNRLTRFQADTLLSGSRDPLRLGEYTVVDRLGGGGMGQVFKAVHRRLERVVALKIIAPSILKDERAVKRFEREARVAGKLIHPHIVTAYDASEDRGIHFLVMEYVDGCDLATLVRSKGPLEAGRAVNYVVQAARGLAYAHAKGIVHRDVKPANLLLDRTGRVRVLDLGLARSYFEESAVGQNVDELTSAGMMLGTLAYIAPEQVGNAASADQRADIYGLGCTLYFLIVGRPPFYGSRSVYEVMCSPAPSMLADSRQVSEELDAVYLKMVAKRPEDRYETMDEVIKQLQACCVTLPTSMNWEIPREDEQSFDLAASHNLGNTDQTISSHNQPLGKPDSGRSSAVAMPDQSKPTTVGSPPMEDRANSTVTLHTASHATLPVRRFASNRMTVALGLLLLTAGVVVAGTIFRLRTGDGILEITLNEPDATVTVLDDQGNVEIERQATGEIVKISVPPGKKTLRIEKPGFEAEGRNLVLNSGRNQGIRVQLLSHDSKSTTETKIGTEKRADADDANSTTVGSSRGTNSPPTPATTSATASATVIADDMKKQREIARWVFEHGGLVDLVPPAGSIDEARLAHDYEKRRFQNVESLPQEAFRIWRVSFAQNSEFNDADLSEFLALAKSVNSITNLNFGGTAITSSGIQGLGAFASQLVELAIHNTPAASNESIEALAGLKKLRTLFLARPLGTDAETNYSNLSPESLLVLQRALPECNIVWQANPMRRGALWVLQQGGRLEIDEDGKPRTIARVAELPPQDPVILAVHLTDLPELDAGLEHLRGMSQLKRLDIAGTAFTTESLRWLSQLPALEILDLSRTPVTDEAIKQLGMLKSIKQIRVTDSQISAEGLASLRSALPDCEVIP